MSLPGMDQRNVTYEQSARAGMAIAMAGLLTDLGEMIYEAGDAGTTSDRKCEHWSLEWRSEPSERIQVRITEPKSHQTAAALIRALGYEVRDKNDHLVVIV
ncbi:hypothetical protein CYG49_04000 [Candidatus Saccharibacteria bacterium]|nr:MAG: hypothetical protein CYG49_04000 [Candidatus Saccharibacteria bacterium]